MALNTAIRASSLGTLFDCAARFEATQIKKIRGPISSSALLGSAVHASTALYDKSVIDGSGITIDEAIGAAVDSIQKPEDEIDWPYGMTPQVLEHQAIDLHRLYCNEISPTIEYIGVEVTCQELELTDLNITLTGTIDRVYAKKDPETAEIEFGIADIKTGKSIVKTDGTVESKNHAFQMGVYSLLAQVALNKPMTGPAQILGLQAGKTAKGQRTGIGKIYNSINMLVGDDDNPGLLHYAAKLINSGIFFPNPKSMMCHRTYCPIWDNCRFKR
jgi:hypothetical protein